MDHHGRRLLRCIALGLPLVVVGCVSPDDGCVRPVATSTHHVTALQAVEASPLVGAPNGCEHVCKQFDVFGVPPEAGIDAGMGDGGIWGAAYYARVVCSEPDADLLTCTYYPTCIGGRAPAGLRPTSDVAGAAGWLARAAHLERASVAAFEELAHELALHGAPASLVLEALAAADDERRHAAAVRALAARRGTDVPAVVRRASAPRSLRALAEANAVEGCVREAYGALVAALQAQHAVDADVRSAYAAIAPDEARHALLSFAIHDWAATRLPPREARAVERRRVAEVAAWRTSRIEDRATRIALGLPDAARRDALLDALAS